ncbi:hypothetical protein PGT21_033171 [Puccinia graminis f. sp. tritici]|uniref:Uncharacterized protein n=1 Tax=Puccinia graminis f. sp. tritici TaxID=56615 RepID=A0A5B0PZF7_PUCGR|nr:hypothetical protein PGT21_033171 [Puccinia graminis f. sp. tritici]KAA1109374.1 hypothetical protein PGTUg99_031094 [Puccinia graminis f. sp. tritici]
MASSLGGSPPDELDLKPSDPPGELDLKPSRREGFLPTRIALVFQLPVGTWGAGQQGIGFPSSFDDPFKRVLPP